MKTAIVEGNSTIIRLLREFGGDVNIKIKVPNHRLNKSGEKFSTLDTIAWLSWTGNIEAMQLLLGTGQYTSVSHALSYGLELVIRAMNSRVVNILLAHL